MISVYLLLDSLLNRLVRIIMDHLDDGLLAGGTEGCVVAHHAMIHWAIDPFGYIAAALEDACLIHVRLLERSGDRRAGREEMFPFRVEIDQCGDVGFPRLELQVIEFLVGNLGSKILVSQASEAMSELMSEDGKSMGIVGRADGIEVVHAATAVGIGVDQNEDGVARGFPNGVADGLHVGRGQVTVDAEGVIAGVEGGILEDTLAGRVGPGFLRGQVYGIDVELFPVLIEWWGLEERFGEATGVRLELGLFLGRVAFRDKYQVYLFGRFAFGLDGHDGILSQRAPVDEDARWVDLLFQQGMKAHVVAFTGAQLKADSHLGIGDGDAVAPGLRLAPGLRGGAPFLEKGIEASRVDQLARGLVVDLHEIAAVIERVDQVLVRATPDGFFPQLLDAGCLLFAIAAEDEIDAETLIGKIGIVVALGHERQGAAQAEGEKDKSFDHHNVILIGFTCSLIIHNLLLPDPYLLFR